MISRIKEFIENQHISIRQFEQKISASNGMIRKAITNNTDIQSKWITSIVDNFPQLNIEWLLTGKGKMLNYSNGEDVSYKENKEVRKVNEKSELYILKSKNKKKGIPLIPIEAMAGFGTGSFQIMEYDTEAYQIPEFSEMKVDFMIRVKGDSMQPRYDSGDIVACKKLTLQDLFFQWNKVYVLDTDQGALIKRIQPGNDDKHIQIVSENPSYQPFSLHLSKVYAIAIVCGVIRFE